MHELAGSRLDEYQPRNKFYQDEHHMGLGNRTIRNTQVLPATRNKLGDAVQMKRIAHALLFSLICFMQSNVRAGMIVHFRPEEPIHMQSLTGKTYDFDLDFNGVIDFILRSDGATFDTVPQDQNSILSIPDAPPDLGAKILPLQAGYEIGSSPSSPAEWVDPSTTPMFSSCMDVGCIGLWLPQHGTHEGYFGVQFEIEDAMHYGWVYLDNTFAGLGGGDIIEWAYQSEAGVPIFAGAIPEPTTLTLFGAGVIALTLTRRKKRIR